MMGIVVTGVFDPRQPETARVAFKLGSRDAQQRPHQRAFSKRPLTRHGREPSYTGATQQTKQHGLGLIVLMLTGQQHLALLQRLLECGVTSLSSSLFKAGASCDVDVLNLQRNAKFFAHETTVFRPGVGNGLQTMVNVDGVERRYRVMPSQIGQQMKKNGRVEAAGESDMPARSIAPGSQGLQHPGAKIVRNQRP